jgi:regulatory LuxR family protein
VSRRGRREPRVAGREQVAAAIIARGQFNDEIAAALVVSDPTVKTHINRIWPCSASAAASRPWSLPTKPGWSGQATHPERPRHPPGFLRTEVAAATGDRKVFAVSVADGVAADADDPARRQIVDRADPLCRGHRTSSLLCGKRPRNRIDQQTSRGTRPPLIPCAHTRAECRMPRDPGTR